MSVNSFSDCTPTAVPFRVQRKPEASEMQPGTDLGGETEGAGVPYGTAAQECAPLPARPALHSLQFLSTQMRIVNDAIQSSIGAFYETED